MTLFAFLTAHAHPGHGPLAHGASHFVTSPWHLLTLLLASAILLFAAQRVQSARARVFARASAVVLAVWGLLA